MIAMPVDLELAAESIRYKEPKLYKMFLKFINDGVTPEEIKDDSKTYTKLGIFLEAVRVLDGMEDMGVMSIYNDYKNKKVVVARRYKV